MSGVAVIRYLLANHAPLTAQVPATRIMAGDLPLNTELPAITVTHISIVDRLTLAMNEGGTLEQERVQVTLHVEEVSKYPFLDATMKLIKDACPNSKGTINGVDCDSILPDGGGPDIPYGNGFLQRSRDFLVRWTG